VLQDPSVVAVALVNYRVLVAFAQVIMWVSPERLRWVEKASRQVVMVVVQDWWVKPEQVHLLTHNSLVVNQVLPSTG